MAQCHATSSSIRDAREFYCHTLERVRDRPGVAVPVGGAYALERYTGIERHTKDFDVFVRGRGLRAHAGALRAAGYDTETPFPHWLGKAFHGEFFVDVIFSSGNGVARVDDDWFEHATADHVFDVPVRLCPAEEMIWSKAFIQERERFDGADIAHLLRARGDRFDWQRLLRRFGAALAGAARHLVLFGFIYPSEREHVPGWVVRELMRRHEVALSAADPASASAAARCCRASSTWSTSSTGAIATRAPGPTTR